MEKPDFLVLKKLEYRKKMFEDYTRLLKTTTKMRQGDGSPVSLNSAQKKAGRQQ